MRISVSVFSRVTTPRFLYFLKMVLVLCLVNTSPVHAERIFSDDSAILLQLANTPENSWVRLNTNQFQDVWVPSDQRALLQAQDIFFTGTPHAVIEAWSSMAWDNNRGHLIFWGGGHANYAGNEVYQWNANTLQWQRGSLPSEIRQVDSSININWFETVGGIFDAPISSHTYDNSEFLPIADRFVTFGGASYTLASAFIDSENINRNTGPYVWDPALSDPDKTGGKAGTQANAKQFPGVLGGGMWQNRDNLPQSKLNDSLVFIEETTAYTEENGKDVLLFSVEQELIKYTLNDIDNPSLDVYQTVGFSDQYTYSGQGAGAYDPSRKLYVRTSGSEFVYWDLNRPRPITTLARVVSQDDFDFSKLILYGMDFDPVRGRFLLWGGDHHVWTLIIPDNPEADNWELSKLTDPLSLSLAPDVSHLTALINDFPLRFAGVLGKWKYIRSLDIFLGVADPLTGDVWAYKPENWNLRDSSSAIIQAPQISHSPEVCNTLDCSLSIGQAEVDHNLKTIEYLTPFSDVPIIITGVPTMRGVQAGVIQLQAVTNSGFSVHFKEWDYLDRYHLQESFGYIALLPGIYHLQDGTVIEAGHFQTSGVGSWESIGLNHSFQNNPSIFLTLQSSNGGNTVTTRVRNISNQSFEVALFEQESFIDSGHQLEDVGYVAIYSPESSGSLPNFGPSVNYSLEKLSLGVASQSVFGQTIQLQEEQSADHEVFHNNLETVFTLLIDNALFGQIASDRGFDTISLRVQ